MKTVKLFSRNVEEETDDSNAVVYFDMDRVLCDFAFQAERYGVLKRNLRINWLKVSLIGKGFWSRMNWLNGALEAYRELYDFCIIKGVDVRVLSSVRLRSGRRGKLEWCRINLGLKDERIFLIKNSADKALYAGSRKLLLDDNPDNVSAFRANGGRAVRITEWNDEVIRKIKEEIALL